MVVDMVSSFLVTVAPSDGTEADAVVSPLRCAQDGLLLLQDPDNCMPFFIYRRLFSTTTVLLRSSPPPLCPFDGAALFPGSARAWAFRRRSSSLESSSLSVDSHSEELELQPPQRLPPQSSLTRWPDRVTPYRSQRQLRSLTLDKLEGEERENPVPLEELSSDSSDGEAELGSLLMR